MFGLLIGADLRFNWKRNWRFIFTRTITTFIWTQILYTQFLYIYQNDIMRNLEVFAVYGIAISVLLKLWCQFHSNLTIEKLLGRFEN